MVVVIAPRRRLPPLRGVLGGRLVPRLGCLRYLYRSMRSLKVATVE